MQTEYENFGPSSCELGGLFLWASRALHRPTRALPPKNLGRSVERWGGRFVEVEMDRALAEAKASLARTGHVEQPDGRWRGKHYTATIRDELGPMRNRIISFRANEAEEKVA